MKICLVYDDKFKYTTGYYCKFALERLGHTVYYMNPMKSKYFIKDVDFFLNVDDDSPYFLPETWKPNVYWVSDTHRGHIQWRFDKCKKADFLFTAQKKAMEQFSQQRENVYWLPHACDELLHASSKTEKLYDIAFVGHINSKIHTKREKMIQLIRSKFSSIKIIGGVFLNEMADVYAQSKIVFNCSLNNDINMRLFEGCCSGSLVVTDYIQDLEHLNLHVVNYTDEFDLEYKLNWYLENDAEREKVAKLGQQEALREHTYMKRMEQMIKIVKRGSNCG